MEVPQWVTKVPDWKKSIGQDKFEIETEAGVFYMPKAEYLTGAQAQRFAEADGEPGGIYAVLDEITPGLGTALLDVPVIYVRELVEAWQGESGVSLGGIRSLCELLDEHAEAVEADLLERGWRLADLGSKFSWRDLLVMVRRFQALPSTATSRAVHGEYWSVTDQLLAAAVDLLQAANWQRAGKKSAPRPKPLVRPWEKPKGRRFGGTPIPVSRFADWWESKRSKRR